MFCDGFKLSCFYALTEQMAHIFGVRIDAQKIIRHQRANRNIFDTNNRFIDIDEIDVERQCWR